MTDLTRKHLVFVEHTPTGQPIYVCANGVAWHQAPEDALDYEVHTDQLTASPEEVDALVSIAKRRTRGV